MPTVSIADKTPPLAHPLNTLEREETSLLIRNIDCVTSSAVSFNQHSFCTLPRRLWSGITRYIMPLGRQTQPEEVALNDGRMIRLHVENELTCRQQSEQPQSTSLNRTGWVAASTLLLLTLGGVALNRLREGMFTGDYKGYPPGDGDESVSLRNTTLPRIEAFGTLHQRQEQQSKQCYQYISGVPGRPVSRRQVSCRGEIKKYQYVDEQPLQCRREQFLARCQQQHRGLAAEGVDVLPMLSNSIPCLCPPPDGKTVEIVPLNFDREVVVNFEWQENQADECKTAEIKKRCDQAFSVTTEFLTKLQVGAEGGKSCLCSPPAPPLFSVVYHLISPDDDAAANQTAKSAMPDSVIPVGNNFDANLRPPDDMREMGRGKAISTTVEDPLDEVKIEKLYDFSCLEERNDMDLPDILRVIGKALQAPVESMTAETKIAWSHNIESKGCPDTQELEKLQGITKPIDYIASNLLMLLPGTRLLNILQILVGPIFTMVADEWQGKKVSQERYGALNQQILFMLRQTIPTLAQSEQLALYHKSNTAANELTENKDIIANRFSLEKETPMIKLAGENYPLRATLENKPFFINNKNRLCFIRFNRRTKQWEPVDSADNYGYSIENKENIDSYRYPFAEELNDFQLDASEFSFVKVKRGDVIAQTGVFINGEFIPAQWDNVAHTFVAFTNAVHQQQQRVIVFTSYGWMFEPESVNTDKYIRALVDGYHTGRLFSFNERFSAIGEESRLSLHEYDGEFIKLNNKYYKVNAVFDHAGNIEQYMLGVGSNAVIRYHNGFFKLHSEDNMLFSLKNVAVTEPLGSGKPFYVEAAALDYLHANGQIINTSTARWLRHGLFLNAKGEPFFKVKEKKFKVEKYDSDTLTIATRNNAQHKEEIVLWVDDDAIYRVRKKSQKPAYEYTEHSGCRAKRAPIQAGSCRPVMVEMNLHHLLQKHIDAENFSIRAPAPDKLIVEDIYNIPAVYQDTETKDYYFLYKGRYFDAKIIDAYDKTNPSQYPCLQLSAQGDFLQQKKLIANIIIEDKQDRIEIKELETFISEKLHVDTPVAKVYLQDRPWRNVQEVAAVEDLVNEVLASGKPFVEAANGDGIASKNSYTLDAEKRMVKEALFPARILQLPKTYIKFLKINTQSDSLTRYERDSQQYIKECIRFIKEEMLQQVIQSLTFDKTYWPEVVSYLRDVLHSSNENLHADITVSFRQRLQRMINSLTEENIYFATAVSVEDSSVAGVSQASQHTSREKLQGSVAVAVDASSRLFINCDKLAIPQRGSADTPANEVVTSIIHALAQSKGITKDFAEIVQNDRLFPPTQDAITALLEKIKAGELTQQQMTNLTALSRAYLEQVPAYKAQIDTLLNPQKLAYLASHDPSYRAHLLLNSAEGITMLTQDIFYYLAADKPASAAANQWLKRHALSRQSETAMNKLSVSTSHLDLASLDKISLDNQVVASVAELPRIHFTEPDLELVYQSGNNYYPIEFVGQSNRIVFIGSRHRLRQVYYYNPENGDIKPIEQHAIRNNYLTYNRILDLYESENRESGEKIFLKYDDTKALLVEFGARSITLLPNDIFKIEFSGFDVFCPKNPAQDIYLAAHASRELTFSTHQLPENMKVYFYTKKWHFLRGHVDDLYDLVKGKFTSQEIKTTGEKMEKYAIKLDEESQINYHNLAVQSQKSLIRLKPDVEVSSENIIDTLAMLFLHKEINLHLYICRCI